MKKVYRPVEEMNAERTHHVMSAIGVPYDLPMDQAIAMLDYESSIMYTLWSRGYIDVDKAPMHDTVVPDPKTGLKFPFSLS